MVGYFIDTFYHFEEMAPVGMVTTAFEGIRYSMRQMGIDNDESFHRWLNEHAAAGTIIQLHGHIPWELQELLMDRVSQITVAARGMEKVCFAMAVGLFKSPILVTFLSQSMHSPP